MRSWSILVCAVILCVNVSTYAWRVDHASGAADPARIELVKVLTIGDETSEDGVIFGEISELVAVDSRGRIFVGDQQASQIYAFTSEGELIESIGSEGKGPGEFSLLTDVKTGPGDTLYAFDLRSKRISAFDPSILDFSYSLAVARDTGNRPARDLVGVLEAGFVVTYEDLPLPGSDFTTERFKYARIVSRRGQARDEPIVRIPSSEFMMVRKGNRFLGAAMPYAPVPVIYQGSDGHVYSGSTESIAIAVTKADGGQIGTIKHSLEAIPIANSELEEWLDRLSEETSRLVRDADLRETKPACSTFVADDSGRVWVRPTQADPEAKAAKWLILDAESRVAGEVVLPSSVTLQVIAAGRAYAVDEAGSGATLVVYEIVE